MRRSLLGLFLLVTACSSEEPASSGPDAAPCFEGPCPKSTLAPCGVPEGCWAGECDLVYSEGTTEYVTCQGQDSWLQHHCNLTTFELEGAFDCQAQFYPPDAGPDAEP